MSCFNSISDNKFTNKIEKFQTFEYEFTPKIEFINNQNKNFKITTFILLQRISYYL